jgi:hypothetical protein
LRNLKVLVVLLIGSNLLVGIWAGLLMLTAGFVVAMKIAFRGQDLADTP